METSGFFQAIQTLVAARAFLKVKTNPVAMSKEKARLEHVLVQYQVFTRYVALMLNYAMQTAMRQGWQGVAAELARNIGQELGSDSAGVAHHILLAKAWRAEFGFDAPWQRASPATERFLARMMKGLRSQNAFRAVGAAYALEDTAVPELKVVLHLVRYLARGRPLAPATIWFFNLHLKVWEPSHEAELRQAATPLLKSKRDRAASERGFVRAMEIMDKWWLALAEEAASQ